MITLRIAFPVLLSCLLFPAGSAAQPAHRAPGPGKITTGPYTAEWSDADLKVVRTAGGHTVFDAAAYAKSAWSGYVEKANGATIQAQFTFRLLSIAGPYLSFEEGIYCDCGGAHPTASKRFKTLDLENENAAVRLSDIFPDHAIVVALEADPAVARSLGDAPKPNSLEQLSKKLEDLTVKEKDCEFAFPRDLLSSFALYDVDGGNALVRLGLPAAAQVCRGEMIQLGLSLSIPEQRLAAFHRAKSDGMLMKVSRRRASLTSIKFPDKTP